MIFRTYIFFFVYVFAHFVESSDTGDFAISGQVLCGGTCREMTSHHSIRRSARAHFTSFTIRLYTKPSRVAAQDSKTKGQQKRCQPSPWHHLPVRGSCTLTCAGKTLARVRGYNTNQSMLHSWAYLWHTGNNRNVKRGNTQWKTVKYSFTWSVYYRIFTNPLRFIYNTLTWRSPSKIASKYWSYACRPMAWNMLNGLIGKCDKTLAMKNICMMAWAFKKLFPWFYSLDSNLLPYP